MRSFSFPSSWQRPPGKRSRFWGRFRKNFFLTSKRSLPPSFASSPTEFCLSTPFTRCSVCCSSFLLAALVGVGLGIIIGRYRWAEDFFLPLVSIGNPVPGLAYAPLFVLWFGLGNLPAVLLVAFAAAFPIVLNTWSGVKAVKEIWIRAAQAMGAEDRQLFWKVVLPSALPYVLTGLRLGLARAWRVLVAVEMLTSVSLGLGWLIFGAREFLNTDVMLAGIAVIGIIGLLLEKLVFEKIEQMTVVRWGMMER